MNIHSIFFKLNALFIVALAATILAGVMTVIQLDKRDQTELLVKSRLVMHTWRTEGVKPLDLIRELGLVEVKQPWRTDVLKQEIARRKSQKNMRHIRMGAVKIIPTRTYLYLWINTRNFTILLRQKQSRQKRLLMPILFFGGMVILLGMIYWLLRRSLLPIRKLEEDIRRYGEGETPRDDMFSQGQDEIARVGNAFYASARRTQQLIRSRQLFVRNIFHELNTPVTKGKILAELTEDPKTRSMLDSIFSRLVSLLRELAQMEQITSEDTELVTRPIRIVELIDQARDLLYMDDTIPTNVTDQMMEADFATMSVAFKNLIDNARKYGKNLMIQSTEKGIEFISDGDPLPHPLAYYIEPFASGEGHRTGEGFGLGLYIVDAIARKHRMHLTYRYREGKNIFALEYVSSRNDNL